MKRFFIITAAVLCLCGCGKKASTGELDATKRFFDAWVYVQKQKHPEYLWKATSLGSYILEDVQGKGRILENFQDSTYVRLSYTQYGQDGTINSTSYAKVAQQLGDYVETNYYGPQTMYASGLQSGLQEALKGMKEGGRRKVVIPAWLVTYNSYDTAEEYLSQKSDDIGSTCVYDLELVEYFDGMQQWSADSIGRYLVANYPKIYGTDPDKAVADSSGAFGFYYIRTKKPRSEDELKDTTVYINYTGRLLNGLVFDTTVRDTAIRYGLDRNKTYEPVSVTLGDEWSDVSFGSDGSSVVQGFARTLSKMKANEKGVGIFISSLGYNYSGSGKSIPAYAPLRFDVELVDNPK